MPLSGTFSTSETSYIDKGGSSCFHLFVHHGPKPPWAAGPIVVWVISPSGPILVGAAFPPPGVWFPVTARLPVLHSVGADIIRPSGCTALGRNEDAHEPGGQQEHQGVEAQHQGHGSNLVSFSPGFLSRLPTILPQRAGVVQPHSGDGTLPPGVVDGVVLPVLPREDQLGDGQEGIPLLEQGLNDGG